MAGRKIKKGQDFGPPKNPDIGQLWYDTMTETIRKWNGKDWTTEMQAGTYGND